MKVQVQVLYWSLQVLEGDNLVTANTFYIRDDQKSVELYTTSKQVRQPASHR